MCSLVRKNPSCDNDFTLPYLRLLKHLTDTRAAASHHRHVSDVVHPSARIQRSKHRFF